MLLVLCCPAVILLFDRPYLESSVVTIEIVNTI